MLSRFYLKEKMQQGVYKMILIKIVCHNSTYFDAIMRTKLFIIICLLYNSIEANAQSEIFKTESDIFDIARKGTTEDLQNLLKNSPEAIYYESASGFTPLTIACYNGNLEVATVLAHRVRDINAISSFGTPLMAAVFKNYVDITKMLLDLDADVNIADSNGNTALHYAVRFSYIEIVKLLISKNADIKLKDNKGFSPREYAELDKNEIIINLLKF
jgi:ankyrin repeat protein